MLQWILAKKVIQTVLTRMIANGNLVRRDSKQSCTYTNSLFKTLKRFGKKKCNSLKPGVEFKLLYRSKLLINENGFGRLFSLFTVQHHYW